VSRTSGYLADVPEPDDSVTLAFAHPDDNAEELNRLLARHIAMKVQPLAWLAHRYRTAVNTAQTFTKN
jgi:hypothetical protein